MDAHAGFVTDDYSQVQIKNMNEWNITTRIY